MFDAWLHGVEEKRRAAGGIAGFWKEHWDRGRYALERRGGGVRVLAPACLAVPLPR
jgi:hypothetical protein